MLPGRLRWRGALPLLAGIAGYLLLANTLLAAAQAAGAGPPAPLSLALLQPLLAALVLGLGAALAAGAAPARLKLPAVLGALLLGLLGWFLAADPLDARRAAADLWARGQAAPLAGLGAATAGGLAVLAAVLLVAGAALREARPGILRLARRLAQGAAALFFAGQVLFDAARGPGGFWPALQATGWEAIFLVLIASGVAALLADNPSSSEAEAAASSLPAPPRADPPLRFKA